MKWAGTEIHPGGFISIISFSLVISYVNILRVASRLNIGTSLTNSKKVLQAISQLGVGGNWGTSYQPLKWN